MISRQLDAKLGEKCLLNVKIQFEFQCTLGILMPGKTDHVWSASSMSPTSHKHNKITRIGKPSSRPHKWKHLSYL